LLHRFILEALKKFDATKTLERRPMGSQSSTPLILLSEPAVYKSIEIEDAVAWA
jgi:hypothetical protein